MKIFVEADIELLREKIINTGILGTPVYGTRLSDKGLFAVYQEWSLIRSSYEGTSVCIYEEENSVYIHYVAQGPSSGLFELGKRSEKHRNNRLFSALDNLNINYEIIENS